MFQGESSEDASVYFSEFMLSKIPWYFPYITLEENRCALHFNISYKDAQRKLVSVSHNHHLIYTKKHN